MRRENLRGQVALGRTPVSGHSPWWATVCSELSFRSDLVGRDLTVEELTQTVPDYPNGRRPRARTVARRLAPILTLVSRGPNGSLGRGAVYRIIPGREVGPEDIPTDDEWLLEAAARMAGCR